jgi:hypothetical protein
MMNALPAPDVLVAATTHAKLSSNPDIFSLSTLLPQTGHRWGQLHANSFRAGYNFSELIQKSPASLKNE